MNAPRRWGRALALVLTVSAITSLLSGVFAIASAGTATINDRRDAHGGPDIDSVTGGRTDDGKLLFRITTYGAFKRTNAPCIRLKAGVKRTEFRICGSGSVMKLSNGARTGAAKVTRPGKRSIVYTIGNNAVGSPSFFRWRAIDPGRHCPQGTCDAAPNNGFRVTARRMTYGTWAGHFLRELKVPRCQDNKVAVVAWMVNEGTSAVWNPLATTYFLPGSTRFNSHGVRNYASLAQGLNGSRLTIERGYSIYGYGAIVRKLDNCATPMETANAIRRSRWCYGCTGGKYVTGLIPLVKNNYPSYAGRTISTWL